MLILFVSIESLMLYCINIFFLLISIMHITLFSFSKSFFLDVIWYGLFVSFTAAIHFFFRYLFFLFLFFYYFLFIYCTFTSHLSLNLLYFITRIFFGLDFEYIEIFQFRCNPRYFAKCSAKR